MLSRCPLAFSGSVFPSLVTGSRWGRFPSFLTVLWRHYDSLPPPRHFVSFIPRFSPSAPLFAPFASVALDSKGLGLGQPAPLPGSSLSEKMTGSPNFPGNPFLCICPALRPRSDFLTRPFGDSILSLRHRLQRLQRYTSISRLYLTAFAVAVYASTPSFPPMGKTRFRSVANLYRPASRVGSSKGFQFCVLPPFLGFVGATMFDVGR